MRRLWLSLLLLLSAGLLAAGWYAYDRGFTRKWRGYVAAEFRKRGVELQVSRLTLQPFRGIVAKEVKIFDARDRRRVLAQIDEMRLVINWANLAQGKTFLDAMELREATLSLPVDPKNPGGEKIEITGLGGLLFFPPQQVYLSRLEADLRGVHVSASGRLINPQKWRASRKEGPDWNALAGPAAAVFEQWRAMKFFGTPAELHLHFSGDLAQPDTLTAELTLWGEKASWNGVPLEKLYLAANFRNESIEVKQLTASDAAGALQISGQYELAQQRATFTLRSNLDVTPWVRAFALQPEFAQFATSAPPTIELTARVAFDPEPRFHVVGHVSAPRFSYAGTQFEGGAGDFSWDGGRWSARDVHIVHGSGELTGDILQLEGKLHTRLKNTIPPEVLRPLLTGAAAEWLGEGS